MSRYGLWTLFGPPMWVAWAVLFAFLGLVIGGPRGRRFATWAAGAGVAATLFLYILPSGFWLIRPLENRFPQTPIEAMDPTDILVLAGGERLGQALRSGHTETREHGERILEGATLAHRFPAARLWAVGGVRLSRETPRDIDWMARAWTGVGVQPARIVLIGGTLDTCENAAGVAAQLRGGARPVLVTSAFHMPRAMACFRKAGLEPLPYPVDYQNAPAAGKWATFGFDPADYADRANWALHEWAGLAYYRATGRTDELWPVPKARSPS